MSSQIQGAAVTRSKEHSTRPLIQRFVCDDTVIRMRAPAIRMRASSNSYAESSNSNARPRPFEHRYKRPNAGFFRHVTEIAGWVATLIRMQFVCSSYREIQGGVWQPPFRMRRGLRGMSDRRHLFRCSGWPPAMGTTRSSSDGLARRRAWVEAGYPSWAFSSPAGSGCPGRW